MNIFTKVKQKGLKNTLKIFFSEDFWLRFMMAHGLSMLVPPKRFLQVRFHARTGRNLNLDNPTTYMEKLQWLKLYDHRPEYTVLVDKYEVKNFVSKKLGEEYVIPLLGVWESAEEINFDSLPEKFVLKTTHDSGSIVICRNKRLLDTKKVRKQLATALKYKYYYQKLEWPYKNVKPRIIAEPYMEDSKHGELRDYKFFTFNGEPKVLYITQGRGKEEQTVADFFDMSFNHLPFTIDHDMAEIPPEKPQNFELMKALAAKLSEGIPQLRVDFYEVDGKVYFGEMTFFHCSGWETFHPEEWDKIFGDWVTLPKKKKG